MELSTKGCLWTRIACARWLAGWLGALQIALYLCALAGTSAQADWLARASIDMSKSFTQHLGNTTILRGKWAFVGGGGDGGACTRKPSELAQLLRG